MKTPAALASPRYWGPKSDQHSRIPRFFVMSDQLRLPDPRVVFDLLPSGSAIVLRHTEPDQLAQLAREVLPAARARGFKVLISNDLRLAQILGADGVHLSEKIWRLGHWRRTLGFCKPNFLITAAQHGASRSRAADYGAIQALLVSPVFRTESHPDVTPIELLRFAQGTQRSAQHVIALGGITTKTVRRLRLSRAYGIAAIGAWLQTYASGRTPYTNSPYTKRKGGPKTALPKII